MLYNLNGINNMKTFRKILTTALSFFILTTLLAGCVNSNLGKKVVLVGKNLNIDLVYPEFIIKKDKLFYDMYGELYDYAMERDPEGFKYLLEKDGYYVECQAYLPIYWDDVKLDKNYRMDLVVNEEIIIELKAVSFIDMQHRKQLWNYMRLTHLPYGMLINFGNEKNLYSEWYQYNVGENTIEKIQLL